MAKLYFKKSGSGRRVIIFFHGFGQDHSVFDPLIRNLEKQATCYALDIYYHGKSIRENRPLHPEEWQKDFSSFLESEGILSFDLVGFSLGGRFAIATSILFQERVEKVILIAPDGIFRTLWYQIANTYPGNRLFCYLMKHPGYFFRFLRVLEHLRFIPLSLAKFARYELGPSDNRQRVYQTWTYFRNLSFAPETIAHHFNTSGHDLHLILGEKDRIIPKQIILNRLKEIQSFHSHTLHLPHHLLVEQSEPLLLSILNTSK